MKLEVAPGKYIIAVSGGVDSVVLLHLLHHIKDLDLVVAHFDHGIRADSASDAVFVQSLAKKYGLPFVTARAELGPGASEAAARSTRYAFLRRVQNQQGAQAIITAHHQDDVLETAIMNLRRGTGRRGLTSLKSTNDLVRPLLQFPKQQLIGHALKRKLSWREDSTNHDQRYTRNYIRQRLLVTADADARRQLLSIVNRLRLVNDQLDSEVHQLTQSQLRNQQLDRQWFSDLPRDVAKEVMMDWLRSRQINDFDAPTIERLTLQCQTKPTGKRFDVRRKAQIIVLKDALALTVAER